jgi:transposase
MPLLASAVLSAAIGLFVQQPSREKVGCCYKGGMAQTMLADPALIRVQYARPRGDLITLVVKTISPHGSCPRCQKPSRAAHSRYTRRVADLPWQGVSVLLELRVVSAV